MNFFRNSVAAASAKAALDARAQTKAAMIEQPSGPQMPLAAGAIDVLERPAPRPPAKRPEPIVERDGLADADWLARYRATCDAIGRHDEGLAIEEFKHFLAKKDMPVFNRAEVVAYMDEIAAKDNPTGCGWNWVPVRIEDSTVEMTFGNPSVAGYKGHGAAAKHTREPASDYYASSGPPRTVAEVYYSNTISTYYGSHFPGHGMGAPAAPSTYHRQINPPDIYRHTIPLHALDKIAAIESELGKGKVVFLVTDFTQTAHLVINPDPFLMAVVPNSNLAHGAGRFIIDIWDEPGFGIERMLK